MTTNEAEVHAHAQALWDVAKRRAEKRVKRLDALDAAREAVEMANAGAGK